MENFDKVGKRFVGIYNSGFPYGVAGLGGLLSGVVVNAACLSGTEFLKARVCGKKRLSVAIKAGI